MIERAAIVSTGDELTTGRIVDSNAAWIADKLFEIGVDVTCVVTVGHGALTRLDATPDADTQSHRGRV